MDEAVNTHNIPNEIYTLAEELRDNGYLNQAIITNKNLLDRRGYAQGFAGFINFEDLLPYHWHFHGKNMAIVRVAQRIPFVGAKIEMFYHFLFGKTAEDAFFTRANMLTDTALEWLAKKRQTPFLLWLHYIDPHSPYDPVPEFSPKLTDITENQEQKMRQPHLEAADLRWNRTRKEGLKLLYDGETRYLDDQLGRIYDQLENSGLLKSTVVVITSDHGEEFLERGNLGHGKTFYEELVKVPLVVRFDGNQTLDPSFSKKPVSLTDLTLTLLDFLGIKDHAEKDWFSEEYTKIIFIEGNSAGPEKKAAIAGNWKLIWDTYENSYELYNLEGDSEEKNNVASSNPSVVGELSQFLTGRVEKNKEAYRRLHKQQGFAPPIDFGEIVGY